MSAKVRSPLFRSRRPGAAAGAAAATKTSRSPSWSMSTKAAVAAACGQAGTGAASRLEAPAALVVEERHARRARGPAGRAGRRCRSRPPPPPRGDPGEARLLRDVGEPALLVAEHAEPAAPGRRPRRAPRLRRGPRERASTRRERASCPSRRTTPRASSRPPPRAPRRSRRAPPRTSPARGSSSRARSCTRCRAASGRRHRLLALLALAGAGEGHPEVVGRAHVVRLGRERDAEGGGRLLELPRLQVHLAEGHVGAEVLRVLLEHLADVGQRVLGPALAARDEARGCSSAAARPAPPSGLPPPPASRPGCRARRGGRSRG